MRVRFQESLHPIIEQYRDVVLTTQFPPKRHMHESRTHRATNLHKLIRYDVCDKF